MNLVKKDAGGMSSQSNKASNPTHNNAITVWAFYFSQVLLFTLSYLILKVNSLLSGICKS